MRSGSIVALIPARGGSKSIPRKNLVPLAGKPLFVHSVQAAQRCPEVNRVIVSTDCPEIAEVAKAAGAEVPFLRPAEYARDDSTDLPVFLHCLEWFASREGQIPELWVHLRPTTPFRDPKVISEAIRSLEACPKADSLRAVCVPWQHPYKMWKRDQDGFLSPLLGSAGTEPYNQPRQQLPEILWQTGYVDITRSRTLMTRSMTGERILPFVMPSSEWLDIDDSANLKFAEWIHTQRSL